MKCTDFENRLNELLDDRLSPQDDAALLAHAEHCLDCRETLAAQESLFRGMGTLTRRTVSPELAPRVLAEFNVAAPTIALPPPVRTPRKWLPMLAAAAAILLAVGVGIWIARRGNHQPDLAQPGGQGEGPKGLAIIRPGKSRPQKVAPTPVTPPVREPESIAVAPSIQVTPNAVPALRETPDIDEAMASIASTWQSSAQWTTVETIDVEQYAPGIRPIRESFEVAIDALLKTMPSGKKESRPGPPQALQPYGEMGDIA
jgi:hypothetical protein